MFNDLITFSVKKCEFIAGREIYPLKIGDKFMLNRKMIYFRDVPFVPENDEEDEDCLWMCDKRNGKYVFLCIESIPVFDSGDMTYDSVNKWYFMYNKWGISVLNIRHGYQLGSVKIYQVVRAKNDAAAALIREIIDKNKSIKGE